MYFRAALILLYCSALFQGQATAQGQNAETLLQEGLVRYNMGQFTRSIRILNRANKKAQKADVKAKIQLHLGLNYGVTGQSSRAKAAFVKALKLDPTLDLKASATKGSIRELFSQARRNLTGELVVNSDPSGGQVSIDGEVRGKTPYTSQLVVGKHTIQVTTPDGTAGYKGDLLIYADKAHTVDAKLQLWSGKLDLTTRPPGARVTIDGKERGATPLLGLLLPPGRHEVSLTLKGHLPQKRSLDLKLNALAKVDVRMVSLQVGASSSGKRGRFWTWIVAGSALAVAGAGLGVGIWTDQGWDQYQEAALNDDPAYNDLHDELPGRCTATNVLFGTAGALAIAAVVLFFLEAPEDRPAAAAAAELSRIVSF